MGRIHPSMCILHGVGVNTACYIQAPFDASPQDATKRQLQVNRTHRDGA